MSYPTRWEAPVQAWLQSLDDRALKPATLDDYRRHVAWLATDHPAGPWTLDRRQLATWIEQQAWSKHTHRKVLHSLQSFYSWALAEGHLDRSPLAGISAVPRKPRGIKARPAPPRWREPIDDYRDNLRAGGRRPQTLALREGWLKRFGEVYADPWAVTPADIAAYLSREDWQIETKRSILATLRSFYKWAAQMGHVSVSPAESFASIRPTRSVPRPASDEAVATALAAADSRGRLLLLLGMLGGLRRAEIAGLHTRDIAADFITVHGKGGHQRVVPLHPELSVALQDELRTRAETYPLDRPGWPYPPPPGGWLFPSDDPTTHLTPNWVGHLVSAVMPAGWTSHTLRHRFATQAYATVRDLRAVQELLGHTNPQTTARYAAVPHGALVQAVAGVTIGRPPPPGPRRLAG